MYAVSPRTATPSESWPLAPSKAATSCTAMGEDGHCVEEPPHPAATGSSSAVRLTAPNEEPNEVPNEALKVEREEEVGFTTFEFVMSCNLRLASLGKKT